MFRIYIILGAIVVLSGACVGLYYKGFLDGKSKQAAAQATAEREAVVESRVIEKDIMRLPKNEVQKRLEIKWCRDCG